MVFLVLGIVCSLNFIVLIHKIRLKRYADACLDCCIFVTICLLFCGSFSALAVGTMASAFVSLYLLFKPVSLVWIRKYLPKQKEKNKEDMFDDGDDLFD